MSISPEVLQWRKAAASTANGACVELAATAGGGVAMRDSKNPQGAILQFEAVALAALVAGIRAGELDSLA